jgi:hypothetical protein
MIFAVLIANIGYAGNLSDYQSLIPSANKLSFIQGNVVRMVVFTPYTQYHLTDKELDANIWTTVSPEIKQRCSHYLKRQKHSLSLKQLSLWLARLLGLPDKQADQRRIVEIEVPVIQAFYGNSYQSIGIFRPCTDPRIGTHSDHSPICPKQMNMHDPKLSPQFKTWFIKTNFSAHRSRRTLWSGRGYTYNRNIEAKNPFGVSEFIVLKGTPIKILPNPSDRSTPYISPQEYCNL